MQQISFLAQVLIPIPHLLKVTSSIYNLLIRKKQGAFSVGRSWIRKKKKKATVSKNKSLGSLQQKIIEVVIKNTSKVLYRVLQLNLMGS